MVVVAQLVRASDCGSEGRRFEPDHPPKQKSGQYKNVWPLSYFNRLSIFFYKYIDCQDFTGDPLFQISITIQA